jgi:membrane protease YdiL (CAAX protease family)
MSLVLAFLAAILVVGPYWAIEVEVKPPWAMYVVPALLAAAAILLFPPIWRGQSPRTRRVRLIAVVIVVAVAMFVPMETRAVFPEIPATAR